jgi:hypothetical protein
LLGVFYPEHISNEETYTPRTRTRPISIDMALLGHTLRLPKETPGNRVITQYFQRKVMGADEKRKSSRRGRVLTMLPRLLQRDFRERLTEHCSYSSYSSSTKYYDSTMITPSGIEYTVYRVYSTI